VVRVQALANRNFNGKVTRTAAALDEATRTLRTEIDLPNDKGELKPGMYALVTLTIAEREDVLVVPMATVFQEEGKSLCAVIEGGKVVRKPVELGLQATGEVEVTKGLAAGEQVIAKNPAGFPAGQRVEVLEAPK
jgi:RND family efflux transporter MFP subunit